ncbi:MAG TPA: glycogen synthase GlgA [Candidatus Binataceae bacterium]|nr:glycogen synthase GlgA [Candidatus Binataceae bacterium]
MRKIAVVAAEIAPYAKAGGLADVIAALPLAMANRGAEPCVILPGYQALLQRPGVHVIAGDLTAPLGPDHEPFRLLRTDEAGIPLYLIDHPGFFSRIGIYGEAGHDYPDNLRRYIFFGRAAAVVAGLVRPDVVHAHDWHAATLPVVMRADHALRTRFAQTLAVFTIHNLAFQGIFPASDYPLLGLDWSWYTIDYLEFHSQVNLMKGAIMFADGASTVSPSYAVEIATDPSLGFGLEGVLRAKGDRFVGILNGADYNEWNPQRDDLIQRHFSPTRRIGKERCRDALRRRLKLPARNDAPIIAMVTRMTPQKGIDLVVEALDRLMSLGVQFVMLSGGDPGQEHLLSEAETRYPASFRLLVDFDNALAHQIQAGSDIFLMPSRFEPCGLTQMYALKYGTVPVVRATGGLRDTVKEFDPATGLGDGFVFEEYDADAMVAAVERAVTTFRDGTYWRRLMGNCFHANFSWDRAAREYLEWFEQLRSTAR